MKKKEASGGKRKGERRARGRGGAGGSVPMCTAKPKTTLKDPEARGGVWLGRGGSGLAREGGRMRKEEGRGVE
eukprot:2832145-Rhodomonas_salina.3